MPTYVYECRTCGKVFEIEQRMSESALTDCECGAKGSLRRLIQPVAVAFKGAGFHINDYAAKVAKTDDSEAPTKEAKPTEAATTETAAAESKPTDSKPADTGSSATKD